MSQTCKWFHFTQSYTGERCSAASATMIFADGHSAAVCPAHQSEWTAHLLKYNKQQAEFRQQDRNANYLQWALGIFATGLVFASIGPVVGFLCVIASGVLYIAMRS